MSNIDLNISEIVRCKDCRHRPILTTDSEHSRPPKIDGVYEDWTCPIYATIITIRVCLQMMDFVTKEIWVKCMSKPKRKPRPSMPKWFWWYDWCNLCKRTNNCNQCKFARIEAKGRKRKRDRQQELRWDGND